MTVVEFIKFYKGPPTMRAVDCVGRLFGRLIDGRTYFDLMDDLHKRDFIYAIPKPYPTECGYCGRPIEFEQKWRSCPGCGGPWEDAIIRLA